MTSEEKWVRLEIGIPFDLVITEAMIQEITDWVKGNKGKKNRHDIVTSCPAFISICGDLDYCYIKDAPEVRVLRFGNDVGILSIEEFEDINDYNLAGLRYLANPVADPSFSSSLGKVLGAMREVQDYAAICALEAKPGPAYREVMLAGMLEELSLSIYNGIKE